MTIRAAVCFGKDAPVRVADVTLDPPREGEVRVRIAAAGVCHSDYSVVTGVMKTKFPCVLGHEGAGVVVEAGPGVVDLAVGDRVVLSWVAQCGECFYCRAGQPNLCDLGAAINLRFRMPDGSTRAHHDGVDLQTFSALGAMAEEVVAPARSVVKLPEDAPLDKAALVGCAVLTGIGAVANTARVPEGATVAVFGVGGVGLNVVQGARLSGARTIVAVDVSPEKLAFARTFGATHVVDASQEDPAPAIRAATEGRGADFAFEAIGRKKSIEQAYASVRRGGTCVVIGIGSRDESVETNVYMLPVLEKRLVGCWYGGADVRRDLPRLLALYREGRLKLDELVTRTYALDEINQAFADLKGSVGRGLVVFP
jgi:S-(hydroxymethyl)glutathione dehydrogenase/alcohol dehydrogenase